MILSQTYEVKHWKEFKTNLQFLEKLPEDLGYTDLRKRKCW